MINDFEIPNGWTLGKLEDLLDYIQPTGYIVESTEYNDSYKTCINGWKIFSNEDFKAEDISTKYQVCFLLYANA